MKKQISVVGYGRFAQTLLRLLGDDFRVGVYTRSAENRRHIPASDTLHVLTSVEQIYEADTIFYCVPISAFERVINDHSRFYQDHHVLIDVLSVKVHPQQVLDNVLKGRATQAILTHPMFGPDSSRSGFDNLPIVMDQYCSHKDTYNFWKDYFAGRKLRVIEMNADEHDRQAASSQGLAHFIGRLLQTYGYKPTDIDTVGAIKLREIMDQVCNDSWELYRDLQNYNPHTREMVKQLDSSFAELHDKTFDS